MEPKGLLIKRTRADLLSAYGKYALLISGLLASAAGLVAYASYGLQTGLTIATLSAYGVGLLLMIPEAVLLYAPSKDPKKTLGRITAALLLSSLSLAALFVASFLFVLQPFVFPTEVGVYNEFMWAYGGFSTAVSFLLFVFDFWHQAWIRENPELYALRPIDPESLIKYREKRERRRNPEAQGAIEHKPPLRKRENVDPNVIEGDYVEKD